MCVCKGLCVWTWGYGYSGVGLRCAGMGLSVCRRVSLQVYGRGAVLWFSIAVVPGELRIDVSLT